MYSPRYGDLRAVAALTDGDCHLCHQPVDLRTYGPTGLFGRETATVDHLRPQSRGGGDHLRNLRLAHGGCNSSRGIGNVKLARLELAGTTQAPRSAPEKTALAVAGGGLAALAGGYVFSRSTPSGEQQFNDQAALASGLLAFAALRLAL